MPRNSVWSDIENYKNIKKKTEENKELVRTIEKNIEKYGEI